MKIIAIIPARSGSKRILDKNIATFAGKPLLAHSIEQAKQIDMIDRVIVSTNSNAYADVAKNYGAEIIIRPDDISKDDSLDLECFQHVLSVINDNDYHSDIIIHLRPTYPTRKPGDIKCALDMFLNRSDATSLRSVTKSDKPVWKKYFLNDERFIIPCLPAKEESNNKPCQLLEPDFWHNGCIDIIRAKTIKNGSMSGNKIIPYFMNENEISDIDTPEEFKIAQFNLNCKELPTDNTFCLDLDGILFAIESTNDYEKAIPIQSTIDLINLLYENNNHIILFTARGTISGMSWEHETKKQLKDLNIKYHKLKFGKPAADFYVDDRYLDINELKRRFLK